MRRPLIAALALALLAALPALAGCADGGRAVPGSPERRAYVADADRLCADYNQAAAQVRQELRQAGPVSRSAQSLAPYTTPLTRARDTAAELARAFARLTPPAEDATRVAPVQTALTRQAQLLGASLAAARADDVAGLERANSALNANADRARRLARDFGYRVCGQGRG